MTAFRKMDHTTLGENPPSRGLDAMKLLRVTTILLVVVPSAAAQSSSDPRPSSPAVNPDGTAPSATSLAAQAVNKILANQCLSCHGTDKKKGGLDLSRRSSAMKGGETGPALVPGQPSQSLILEKVVSGEMPPHRPSAQTSGRSRPCLDRSRRPLHRRSPYRPPRRCRLVVATPHPPSRSSARRRASFRLGL